MIGWIAWRVSRCATRDFPAPHLPHQGLDISFGELDSLGDVRPHHRFAPARKSKYRVDPGLLTDGPTSDNGLRYRTTDVRSIPDDGIGSRNAIGTWRLFAPGVAGSDSPVYPRLVRRLPVSPHPPPTTRRTARWNWETWGVVDHGRPAAIAWGIRDRQQQPLWPEGWLRISRFALTTGVYRTGLLMARKDRFRLRGRRAGGTCGVSQNRRLCATEGV